jgi:2-iminobutanoate/2-iminopropanoate deaminase
MSKKIISTTNAPAAIGPYSQANFINGVLYISGQIPINPATGELEDGIEKETHQVMKNLKAILEEAGMSFSNVVKATIFLKSMDDFAVMNEIYASYLDANSYPARETIQVACLPKNVSVEISMIAHQF